MVLMLLDKINHCGYFQWDEPTLGNIFLVGANSALAVTNFVI